MSTQRPHQDRSIFAREEVDFPASSADMIVRRGPIKFGPFDVTSQVKKTPTIIQYDYHVKLQLNHQMISLQG